MSGPIDKFTAEVLARIETRTACPTSDDLDVGKRVELKTALLYHLAPLAKLPRDGPFDLAAIDAAAQISMAAIEREIFSQVDESLVLFTPAVHWREATRLKVRAIKMAARYNPEQLTQRLREAFALSDSVKLT